MKDTTTPLMEGATAPLQNLFAIGARFRGLVVALLAAGLPGVFGAAMAADIGQSVWRDSNGNGIRDGGEPGVENVRVKLFFDNNGDGHPERMISTALTDSLGQYSFNGLGPGLYSIGLDLFSLPDDLYRASPQDAGSDETLDSDLEINVLRTSTMEVVTGSEDFSNHGSIGLLQGDGNVTPLGETAPGSGLYYWRFQDHIIRVPQLPLPAGRTYEEVIGQWLRWYTDSTDLQRMYLFMEDWMSTQYGGPNALFPDERVVLYGDGSGSFGFQQGPGVWSSGLPDDYIYQDVDDPYLHTITIYENHRGTLERFRWRMWTSQSILLPWLMATYNTYWQRGNEIFDKTDARYLTTKNFLDPLGLWEISPTTFEQAFPNTYNPDGEQIPYTDPDTGQPATVFMNSGTLFNGILLTVATELGIEKMAECLDNMRFMNIWPASREVSGIDFKKAVNDATDGFYASKFGNEWKFPLAATYANTTGVDTGAYVAQDSYLWDCASHLETNIRPGAGLFSERADTGMLRWTVPVRDVGQYDFNESATAYGGPPIFTSSTGAYDASSVVSRRELALAHQVANGSWVVSLENVSTRRPVRIEGTTVSDTIGMGTLHYTTDHVATVSDGELNLEIEQTPPPGGTQWMSGLALRNLAVASYSLTETGAYAAQNEYQHDFAGASRLFTVVPGVEPFVPSHTGTGGVIRWNFDVGIDRFGIAVTDDFSGQTLSGDQRSGITFRSSNLNAGKFSHTVQNGLWRVELGVLSFDNAEYAIDLEGSRISTTNMSSGTQGTLYAFVDVTDEVLDFDFYATNRSSLATITDLRLTLQQEPPFVFPFPTLPGIVQAEDFNSGANGESYFDSTAGNSGDLSYRPGDVDIYSTTDVDQTPHIGSTVAGEYWDYFVNAIAEDYTFSVRGASSAGATLSVSRGGEVLGTYNFPATGGSGAWQTVSFPTPITLQGGDSLLRVEVVSGSLDLNWYSFYVEVVDPPFTVNGTPFGGTPRTVPGRVEAEDANEGVNGEAYLDDSAGNLGGFSYRTDDVDVEAPKDGGDSTPVVGFVNVGEFLKYTLDAESGIYELDVRASTPVGGIMTFYLGSELIGQVAVPNSGNYDTFETVTLSPFVIPVTGQEVLTVAITKGSAGFNINWFALTRGSSTR